MSENQLHKRPSRAEWIRRYVLGLGIGTAAALYGIVAMLMGQTFLPGLRGNGHMVKNRSGLALAAGYLLGGIYLLLRFYVEKRMRPAREEPSGLYWLQNAVLVGFIASLIYLLLNVMTVH